MTQDDKSNLQEGRKSYVNGGYVNKHERLSHKHTHTQTHTGMDTRTHMCIYTHTFIFTHFEG